MMEEENHQIDLLDRLVDCYELSVSRPPRLFCNKEPIIHVSNLPMPKLGDKVRVSKIGEEIRWDCDFPMELSSKISESTAARYVQDRFKYKMRHEFVCEALSTTDTDRKLSECFTKLHDSDDVLTPDFIFKDPNGVIHVVEVATSRTQNVEILSRSMEHKIFKYESPLMNRVIEGSCSTLTAIVVGVNAVASNIQLSQNLVDELLLRMTVATTVEDVAYENGILLQSTEEESHLDMLSQEIKLAIQSSEKKGDREDADKSKIFITDSFISHCMGNPDEQSAASAYYKARKSTVKMMKGINNRRVKHDQYRLSQESLKGTVKSIKPVIPFPFIIPGRTADSQLPTYKRVLVEEYQHNPLGTLWTSALAKLDLCGPSSMWKKEDKAKLRNEALEEDKIQLKKIEVERKKTKKLYHRVNVESAMTTAVRNYLAKDGVLGKSKEGTAMKKKREEEQSRPMSYSSDTNDIFRFIHSTDIFGTLDDIPDYFNDINKLIGKSSSEVGNCNTICSDLKEWQHTKLFLWLEFISDIAFELAISFKQNTSSKEFILKKPRFWNCYILIKPTNSRSHMFFSLLIPKDKSTTIEDTGCVGRKLISAHDLYLTDFVSVRADKIENLATASASFMGLLSFYSWFYKTNSISYDKVITISEFKVMLLLTLLVKIEDKAQTEEVITMTRYMYMEVFKSNQSLVTPNPFKMLKKFPKLIRSRLSLIIIKLITSNFNRMLITPPVKQKITKSTLQEEGEDVSPGDEWQALLNCFTGSPIPDASRALSLFYLGYFKNKNEVAQGNVEFKLIEKVIEEEAKLDKTKIAECYGWLKDEDTPKGKMFDLNSIMFGCSIMEKRLKNIYGPEYKKILEKDILTNLSRQLSHEIATLKASSTCDHKSVDDTISFKSGEDLHRIKVIEAIATSLEDIGLNPFLKIETFVSFIETTSRGVVADLFKKNQHGGLREIYVLTLPSRIVQLFVESISRTLCSYFEEETLTHPGNKLRVLDRHKSRAAKYAKAKDCSYSDYCNSSDKTRWNQNFLITALSVPLFRMTPDYFHPIIKRILNLWADKLIRIPPEVCTLLLSRTHLTSDSYNDLLKVFWGDVDRCNDGNKRNYMRDNGKKNYVNLTTGMMQGILHYTSSLLHISYLSASRYFTLKTLRFRHPDWKFMMTQVCSSDDSASIISLFSDRILTKLNRSNLMAIVDVEIALYTLSVYCQWFCMTESEKSTICLHDYIEFNSEFLFSNTVSKPFVKMIAACTNLTESESFTTRFHTLYNLISDLLSSGFPSWNTSIVQISQAWLHYKSLGASTNGLYVEYSEDLMKYPSSSMGFFNLDSDKICGLMGYSFSEYMSYLNNETLAFESTFYDIIELETNPSGGFSPSLIVKNGDSKKWHTLLDRIEGGTLRPFDPTVKIDKTTGEKFIDQDKVNQRRYKINSNHELLFKHPTTKDELRLKLLMKASMPGVGKSLSKGNPFLESLSLSMYAINTHCFTKTSLTSSMIEGMTKRGKKTYKTSLLLEMKRFLKQFKEESIDSEKFDRYLQLRFPMKSRYDEALAELDNFRTSVEIKIERFRQRKTTIVIQPRTADVPFTLMQICCKLWFGFRIKTSERIYKRCLEHYQHLFPWLKSTFEDSLWDSPFQSSVELYNFVSSLANKNRKIVVNGPGIYSNTFSGQIRQLCRKHYKDGILLTSETDPGKPGFNASNDIDKLKIKLSLSLSIPIQELRQKEAVRILSQFECEQDVSSLKLLRKNDLIISLMSNYLKETLSIPQIVDILMETRIGMFIVFPRPQTLTTNAQGVETWSGPGEALVFYDGFFLKVLIKDKEAISIIVPEFENLRKSPYIIADVFRELGIRPSSSAQSIRTVAKYYNNHFLPVSASGTPICVSAELKRIHLDMDKLQFMVSDKKCGLYSTAYGRRIPIIEFKASIKDMSPQFGVRNDKNSIWDDWMELQPIDMGTAVTIINKVVKDEEEYKRMSDNIGILTKKEQVKFRRMNDQTIKSLKTWISDTLSGRLRYRGESSTVEEFNSTIMTKEEDGMDEEDLDDNFLEDFYEQALEEDEEIFDLAQQLESKMKEEIETTALDLTKGDITMEQLEMLNEDVFNIEDMPLYSIFRNITEDEIPVGESIIKRDAFNYIYMHRFWDEFIDTVIERDPKFFPKTFQGIPSTTEKELSENIIKLFGIKQKAEEQTLQDKYMKRTVNLASMLGLEEDDEEEDQDTDQ